MFGVSRSRILSAVFTSILLVALVGSCIIFVSHKDGQQASQRPSRPLASATATRGATVQYTPAPGITVTVTAIPTATTSTSIKPSSNPSNGAAVTYVVPPRYPTPVPTSSVSSSGGVTPTATATMGGSATPTPSASAWRPGVTPTPTPVFTDDAQLVSESPTGPITQGNPSYTINATFLNTGTSTWDSARGYQLQCIQYCGFSATSAFTSGQPTYPGQAATFVAYESISSGWLYSVNTNIWQLVGAAGLFGPQIAITIIHHGWYLDFQEASPSCQGDNSQWATTGTGVVACSATGLEMAQGGSNGVGLDLQATPAAYDPGNYSADVHVHFNTASNAVLAGIIITEPTANSPAREVIMVSPAGYMCAQTNTAFCLPPYPLQQIPASSDYDLSVTVSGNGTSQSAHYTPGGAYEGGIVAGGLTGLIEVNGSGSPDAAYFSNYQLYQYK